MRHFILFLFSFFLFSFISFSQGNQLIYKKVIPGVSAEFNQFPDSSGYAIYYKWLGAFNTPGTDIGVWSEVSQSLIIDDEYFQNGVAIYNSYFEHQGTMLNQYGTNANMNYLPLGQIILHFSSPLFFPDYNEFPTDPIISNYPSATYGQSVFLKYNPEVEMNEGILNFSMPTYIIDNTHPFSGFKDAGSLNSINQRNYKNTTVLNDSILISYLHLRGEQIINDTLIYNNWGGQVNLIRLGFNLLTNEVTSQQIGSSTGSQITLRVESAPNMSGVWRAGLVRGNNTPISISDAQVEMLPNDSLYHVFVTKESTTGETEWLTELYAYNNTSSDTTPSSATQFDVNNEINSILKTDESLFITSRFYALAKIGDTLLYRNFMGQNLMLSDYIPYFGSWPNTHIPFSEDRVYKINANGNVMGKLSYNLSLPSYSATSNINGSYQQNVLYEVADKLAWVHTYYALNDTLAEFIYTAFDGSEQNTSIALPAGRGLIILWLDNNLNILDHWLMPCQGSGVNCMSIASINPYNTDTLLIHGVLNINASSDFNPFDDTELVTVEDWSSFFAFYTAPEILTGANRTKERVALKLFPNPTTGEVRLTGLGRNSASYVIYDLSGRTMCQGTVSENETIAVDELLSGMYILSVKAENGWGTHKFVVE